MIFLKEEQLSRFELEKERLLDATSIEEVTYHAANIHEIIAKIHKILNDAELENDDHQYCFTEEFEKQFNEYKRKLLDANNIEEIRYYKSKIMELFDNK